MQALKLCLAVSAVSLVNVIILVILAGTSLRHLDRALWILADRRRC